MPVPREPGQLRDGLRFAWRSPLLRIVLLTNAFIGMLTFNFPAFYSSLVKLTFHAGAAGFGVAESLNAITAVGAGFVLARRLHHPTMRLVALASALLGVSMLYSAVSPSLSLFLAGMPYFGAAVVCYTTVTQSLLQQHTPPEKQGRIMSLFMLGTMGTTPIGGILTGWITDRVVAAGVAGHRRDHPAAVRAAVRRRRVGPAGRSRPPALAAAVVRQLDRRRMDFRAIGDRVRNWGRWGDDDERGTLNLITPDKLVAAGALIRTGKVFDLGIPFGSGGPQPGRGRINPVLLVSETGADQRRPGAFHYADDYIFMPLQSASQWDALGHVFYDDQLYNGFSASENITPHGAHHCSITAIAKGVTGRGVLLDIARLKGVEWLEAGYAITPADLEEAAAAQGGVAVGSGDILLFRTGWRRKFLAEQDPVSFMSGEPGLGLACAEWLHEREVAVVALGQLGDRGAPR